MSLIASELGRTYSGTPAVHALSFRVEPGTVVGLLGPNGAGKTTLVRVLTTILEPTTGAFSIDGIPHTDPQRLRQSIGVLPESNGFPRELSGREYLQLHSELFGKPPGTAARLLREVGLAERGDDLVRTYSRGMRQRLGIARALVNDPRVVFLDEPTLGLDPAGRQQVLDLVRAMARERGAIVVYSTHFMEEVEEVCDEVIIIDRGRVVLQGRVDALQSGSDALRVQVGEEDVEPVVAALNAAGHSAAADGGWITVEGQRASILKALGEGDAPVLRLIATGGRLRDVFLQATEGPGGEA